MRPVTWVSSRDKRVCVVRSGHLAVKCCRFFFYFLLFRT